MDTVQQMMINAYNEYLKHETKVDSFSTRRTYLNQAAEYYNNETEEKPNHLEDAEKMIGYEQ